jgi:hypothetical protein
VSWKYPRVRAIGPDLAERALRASGFRGVGNRIPGSLVLRDAGWDVHEAFDVMTDLQGWSRAVFEASLFPSSPYWSLRHLEERLVQGTACWVAQGSTGPCPCLMCRVRRMWIGDMEEALSEW